MITGLDADPAPPRTGGRPAAGGSGEDAGGAFSALVAALLGGRAAAGTPGAGAAPAPGSPGLASAPGAGAVASTGAEPARGRTAARAGQPAGPVAAGPVLPSAAAGTSAPGQPTGPVPVAGAGQASPSGAGQVAAATPGRAGTTPPTAGRPGARAVPAGALPASSPATGPARPPGGAAAGSAPGSPAEPTPGSPAGPGRVGHQVGTGSTAPDGGLLTPVLSAGRPERAPSVPATDGPTPGLPPVLAAGPALPAPAAVPAGPAAPAVPVPVPPGVLPGVTAALLAPVWPLRRGPDGVHRLTVRLHPDELGEVGVTVTLRGGRVDLALVSGSDSSREVLRAALPDLRRELEAGGLVAGSLDVRADARAGDGGLPYGWTGPHPAWPDGSADGGVRRTPAVVPPPAPTVTAPTRDLPGPAGLDLHL